MGQQTVELFVLKAATISSDLARVSSEHELVSEKSEVERATDALIAPHMAQIDFKIRTAAARMAEFYQIFYMLENDIRTFVSGVLQDAYGNDWWLKKVPDNIAKYTVDNKAKETKDGLPPRSKDPVDYISFGHLGEVIKYNWDVFAGLFPSCEIERMEKVISRLNTARGPIAHCGYLPEDEVVRLKLAVRDWYGLTE